MFSSNSFFLSCVQISQEAGQMVWYSHLLKNFPQFVVIYTVKGFGIVNKAEVDVFLEFSSFFYDPVDVGNLISGSSAFSKSSLNIWNAFHTRSKAGPFMLCLAETPRAQDPFLPEGEGACCPCCLCGQMSKFNNCGVSIYSVCAEVFVSSVYLRWTDLL